VRGCGPAHEKRVRAGRGGGTVRAAGRSLALLAALFCLLAPRALFAQAAEPPRDATFGWDTARRRLFVSVAFRDVVDAEIRRKLDRGLPTTIVLTGTLYHRGSTKPVSTTVQSCKITYLVWEEAYALEITRPDGTIFTNAVAIEGVLRRCAETERLFAGTSDQVPFGVAVYLKAKVQVNPVSAELLQKIKRWVSRPSGTGTAAPGDALFSTFTGLFLQRIGDAERELNFTTKARPPRVQPRRKR
jgi:hypothetical protein